MIEKNKEIKDQAVASRTRIHNVRFYHLPPRAINCMDFNKIESKLALARNDGSLEIWNMEHTPYLERTAGKVTADTSVDSIAWAGTRLFSAGLNGGILEWDTTTMTPRLEQRVTGNAIWCLAVNRQCTEIAVGTEEGYINIFDIEYGEFQYKLLFDKQEGRVLCCSYDITGNYLATGSVNALRLWNAKTGHALQKMTLPKNVDNNDTIIWTIRVLDDFSIIAGDSRGCITVYDGHTGDHLEAHQVLKADVLALSVNEAQNMLVCSGVEPIIRIYAKTQIKRDDTTFYRWVKYLQRAVHNYDVKSLVCITEDRIVSGGVDGYLGVSYLVRMRSTISRQGPFLRHPCATVAGEANSLLLRYPEYLECWRLGQPKSDDATLLSDDGSNKIKSNSVAKINRTMALETTPSKLFQLKSKNDDPILCATISPDGKKICYSTPKEVRLFTYIVGGESDGEALLTRIANKPQELYSPMSHVCYSHDSQRLFLLSNLKKQLLILKHLTHDQENDLTLLETIDLSKQLKGHITHFALSFNSKCIALADTERTIAVWKNRKGKHFEYCLSLPRYETAAVTAIAIHANIPSIVVAFTDSRVAEYDIEKARYTCWSDQSFVVPNTETHCFTQILLDDRNPNIIILQSDSYLLTLEKYMTQNEAEHNEEGGSNSIAKKVKKASKSTKDRDMFSLRLKYQKSYEHLVYTLWLKSDELVTISVNQNLFIEQLPPAFVQKKYGTK